MVNQEEKFSSIDEAVEALSGSSRRSRQLAAAYLADVAQGDSSVLLGYSAELIDALNRPESQTRWVILDVLTLFAAEHPELCDEAVIGAETALFDEDSGMVRLSAFCFLSKLAAVSPERSVSLWPLLDEALQCYHGDLEFSDMLNAILEFSQGDIADEVAAKLAARMKFDAENSRGSLARRAQMIIDNVTKG